MQSLLEHALHLADQIEEICVPRDPLPGHLIAVSDKDGGSLPESSVIATSSPAAAVARTADVTTAKNAVSSRKERERPDPDAKSALTASQAERALTTLNASVGQQAGVSSLVGLEPKPAVFRGSDLLK